MPDITQQQAIADAVAAGANLQTISLLRRAAAIKAEVSIALDTAVAALVGVEFMGTERRRELAAMLTRVRIAVEESL